MLSGHLSYSAPVSGGGQRRRRNDDREPQGSLRVVNAVVETWLEEAYELILSGWCQGASARDASGKEIEPSSAFARQWSASGAIERVWRRATIDPNVAIDAYAHAHTSFAAVVHRQPQEWNDAPGRTVREVLDAFAVTLARVRGESA